MTEKMSATELRQAIETLWPGHGGQTKAARHFSIDSRRIREYLREPVGDPERDRPVPEWLAIEIGALLDQFPNGVSDVNPPKSMAILHDLMQRAGWTPEQSAVAILGAAHALAARQLGRDRVNDLLRNESSNSAGAPAKKNRSLSSCIR